MKIAQVAPLFESVPPQGYGGTERVVSYLTEALVELGHDVTLFASGDSRTRARLVPAVERSLRLDPRQPDWLVWHTMMLDRVFSLAADFDVVHFHVDFLHYPLVRRCLTPCLTTLHGRLDLPDLAPLHRHFREQALVSVSNSQRASLAGRWLATVPHGLPTQLYRFHRRRGRYFAFLGRISPEKRLDRAIRIAQAVGVPLRIAAKVDRVDSAYFEREIKPLLDSPLVRFEGELGEADKDAFLGNARALLFPIDWPEPFGLAMIEAMACGTPVIAWRCGSVPEVVEHGVSGWIVNDMDQAVDAARRIGEIDRAACRRAFERRFTAHQMAERYLAVYAALSAARRSEPDSDEAERAPHREPR
ncbi:glycosyltransferase family 4 protein [Caldimonas sp. KR1-144]|uniref:glycosyltransferase family 4 protein n=1 Tax=Caldimonas sp. KR1-144 TaxID=3400911 RepID=UPI003C0FE3AB